MWKCIRCEKENQDSEEMCTACGHGKTMNYIQHRTLSKVSESVAVNWKIPMDSPEYFIKQGSVYIQKIIECLEKTNADQSDMWDMTLSELKKYFETGGIAPVKEKHVLMSDNNGKYVLGSDILRESIHKVEFIKIDRTQVPDSAWDVSADKNGTIWAWTKAAGKILKIGAENRIYANPDCGGFFQNYKEAEEIEFNNMLDTARVTNMEDMFKGCKNLSELDVSGFDTTGVTNMAGMFSWCANLTQLDVSRFDTANVTDMSMMFHSCENLQNLDVSGFDTAHVTDMFSMFWRCKSLYELDVTGFDTACVTDMKSMFSNCENLTKLDVSRFNTANVTDMSYMFLHCKNLTELTGSNTVENRLADRTSMFTGCELLKKADSAKKKQKTIQVQNQSELDRRLRQRTYEGNSIREICNKFLLYEANQIVDNARSNNLDLINNLQIYQNHNIYLIHDDTWRKNGQSGFALTEQGIYTKALFKGAKFLSWKEFQKCGSINIFGDEELIAGGKCIALLSGDRSTLLELERMFISIHEYLNRGADM